MGNISNTFRINVIDDGTSLHGNLVADKTLSQSWDGGCSPDWHTNIASTPKVGTKDQPTIKLTLLNGTAQVGIDEITNVRWYYNDKGTDVEIVFQENDTTIQYTDENNVVQTVTGKLSTDGKFLKCTAMSGSLQVPALRIVQNLASSTNVDIDTITIKGVYNAGNGGVEFSATVQIRITERVAGGYDGLVYGVDSIVEKNQSLVLWGVLTGGSDSTVPAYTTKWYVNGTYSADGSTISGNTNAFQISEGQITGKANIRCDFLISNEVVATTYAEVDDMYDNEDIQFSFDGSLTNSASMRSSNSDILVKMWVADNGTPNIVDPSWNQFKVQLIDANKQVIMTDPLEVQIPAPDSNGLRTLPIYTGSGVPEADLNKAYIDVAFQTVKQYAKKNLSIIAYAYQVTN